MYFKVSMRTNPETRIYSGYYRLVESYRNQQDRVCHRTILNAGYLDNLTTDQLNQIQKILTNKVNFPDKALFEAEVDDPVVSHYVDTFYNRMISEKRIDIAGKKGKDMQLIDINSIKNKDVREIGSEWLAYQALEQLQVAKFLGQRGWGQDEINLALTHIISRAVCPASELGTARWIKENSAVCEVTGYAKDKINKDKLYETSLKLFAEHDALEQHLSKRTNELFDIEDKILLYDLTNTYFEGRKEKSVFAKFGRSKEKRNDAKLIVLALVVNREGFIKYSTIFEGNIADCKTLSKIIGKLRNNTSCYAKKALVVIDAGIANEDNLKMIKSEGFDYLCVTRSSMKNYIIDAGDTLVTVTDNTKKKIGLCKVKTGRNTDYYLKVDSQAKAVKERSMNQQFRERFEAGMQRIADALSKKSGIKREDKVYERIGRLKQKYPSIHRYFDIQVILNEESANRNHTGKEKNDNAEKRTVAGLKWDIKKEPGINARSGVYFLRTSLDSCTEREVWDFYNTIREIEATFRTLKNDLDLRPVFHHKDESTMAHLHLGLLAYWVVNTLRHQLKSKNIRIGWKEITRIMNTQKAVTTTAQNVHDQIIVIRRCSEPNQNVKLIYDALKFKYAPFVKKKFVVHKPISKNDTPLVNQVFLSG
jgi:hypothetical protein